MPQQSRQTIFAIFFLKANQRSPERLLEFRRFRASLGSGIGPSILRGRLTASWSRTPAGSHSSRNSARLSTVTEIHRGSTLALRRSTFDLGLQSRGSCEYGTYKTVKSRPDYGFGFQVEALQHFKSSPFRPQAHLFFETPEPSLGFMDSSRFRLCSPSSVIAQGC